MESVVAGKVHLIDDAKEYGQKGFRKRLVVLTRETGKFTNYIPIEFVQDGVDQVDGLNVGDNVEIIFRLSGRRWQKDPSSEVKYFLSAEGLRFRVNNPEPVATPEPATDVPF
ncbi:uncharacterized protein METZ01_LOCUS351060 [marine metagenome]|uniref:DUF3127 domain-containing protein n=1 Tax=marine metagenome TaxID=408172 RepID=A0A382RKP3_9ZZZZ